MAPESTAITVRRGTSLDKTQTWLVDRADLNLAWRSVEKIMFEQGQRTLLETYSLEEVYTEIQRGIFDLWLVHDHGIRVVGLCGAERHFKQTSYHIYWVGGKGFLWYWREAIERIESFARDVVKADVVRILGRPGWRRVMRENGYKCDAIQLSRKLG